MRWLACFILALGLHILAYIIITYSESRQKISDGMMGEKGDEFAMTMISYDLSLGELKMASFDMIKGEITANENFENVEILENEILAMDDLETPEISQLKEFKSDLKVAKKSKKPVQKKRDKEISNSHNALYNSSSKDLVTSAPSSGSTLTATSKDPGSGTSKAKASWQGLVISRLNKFKKYPTNSLINKEECVIEVRVKIDRNGGILSKELIKPCKFPSLNSEALELFTRANPLPKPPKNLLKNETLNFIVPIEFDIKKHKNSKNR